MAIDLFEDPDRGLLVNEVNYTMEFPRNSIAPTNVDIPERMVAFCLKVAKDGWDAANGWPLGTAPHVAAISLADGAQRSRARGDRISAAIIGASGYTGGELLRLLLGHRTSTSGTSRANASTGSSSTSHIRISDDGRR